VSLNEHRFVVPSVNGARPGADGSYLWQDRTGVPLSVSRGGAQIPDISPATAASGATNRETSGLMPPAH
jgi:hypothetical protein